MKIQELKRQLDIASGNNDEREVSLNVVYILDTSNIEDEERLLTLNLLCHRVEEVYSNHTSNVFIKGSE